MEDEEGHVAGKEVVGNDVDVLPTEAFLVTLDGEGDIVVDEGAVSGAEVVVGGGGVGSEEGAELLLCPLGFGADEIGPGEEPQGGYVVGVFVVGLDEEGKGLIIALEMYEGAGELTGEAMFLGLLGACLSFRRIIRRQGAIELLEEGQGVFPTFGTAVGISEFTHHFEVVGNVAEGETEVDLRSADIAEMAVANAEIVADVGLATQQTLRRAVGLGRRGLRF